MLQPILDFWSNLNSLDSSNRLKSLKWVVRPTFFVILYGIWIGVIRLLSLSIITYFSISPTTRFQDISDIFSSNEVSLMGFGALLFLLLTYGLNPRVVIQTRELVARKHVEKYFLPGFIRGTFIAGGLILVFLMSNFYRYLGYFINLEDAPFELINVLLRMIALAALIYSEEFIFRQRLTRELLEHRVPVWLIAQISALVYCGIKVLQFDFGFSHFLTLYLIALALFYQTRMRGHFAFGAGFLSAILVIFHPLLSLPIFGNDFSGVLIVKYAPPEALSSNMSDWIRRFCGGEGGPLSSLAFQLFLILDITRNILKKGKIQ